MKLIERYRGALLGLAAGDALGTTLEFRPPGTFAPISDMVGGGPFQLQAGQWTDDTSMALCLATSLVERRGFDANDQMSRYVRWWQSGYLSSTGRCFDIGNTVAAALRRFNASGDPYAGLADPQTAGNGSIMRLAPVPLFFAGDQRLAIEFAADSSRTTHAADAAVDGCRYFAALLLGALAGASKEELLAPRYSPVPGLWREQPLDPAIDEIAAGSFKRKSPPDIRGAGYVAASLEAALWAFYHSDTFRDGCLLAVNLGDDADTTGAVYGQLAGACYGEQAIPPEWRSRLALRDLLEALADRLYQLAHAEETDRQASPSPAAASLTSGGAVTPIPDSYWVLPGRLLAGEYPGARADEHARARLRKFLDVGVTFFLDLTEEGELRPYEPLLRELAEASGRAIEYRRMAIRDLDVPTVEQMERIQDSIHTALAAGHVVYVHCWGGIGRTGTVVGCHLVRGGAEGAAALEQIRRLRFGTPDGRRDSPETEAQRRMVLEWLAAS